MSMNRSVGRGFCANMKFVKRHQNEYICDMSSPRAHDRFFKQIFTKPKIVRDFIETYLPVEVVSHLDLDDLEVGNTSYVDSNL